MQHTTPSRDPIPAGATSSLIANYKHTVKSVRTYAEQLQQDVERATKYPSGAHTAGNITAAAGRLDAAREKARTLREALEMLGLYDRKLDEESGQ